MLGSKKEISGCSRFPVHARCYGWRHVNVSYQVPCPTSFSVSSSLANSLCDYELDKQHEQELQEYNYLRFPVLGQIVLLLRRGLAKSQGHVYLEKFVRFPSITIQGFTQEEWDCDCKKR